MRNKHEGQRKRGSVSRARHVVQAVAFAVFLLPVLAVGWGLFGQVTGGEDAFGAVPADQLLYGSFSASSLFGIPLVDPFAALEAIAAAKSFTAGLLLGMLPILVLYGLVRGRAFCGWVCPMNLVLEIVDWLCGKLHIRVQERVLPRHAKAYVALAVLALSFVLGFPVFEALSPIGFLNKGIVFGSTAGALTFLAVVLVELFWGHRVWCRAICPLGGFYEVLGKVGQVNVRIDHDACIQCERCMGACLCDPEILEDPVDGYDDIVRAGDCMLCGKCVDACPQGALRIGLGRPRAPYIPEDEEPADGDSPAEA